MKIFLKTTIIIVLSVFMSCRKDKDEPVVPEEEPPATGSLKVAFENMVGNENLSFGTSYANMNGDTFKVSKFNYFISNIVVIKDDNTTVVESNSYHLVKHSNSAATVITINNIPAGSYKSIKFMLGIDSTRNVSGAQTGDLDPVVASDMYWSWSSGYIFFKLEGTAPKSGDPAKALEYHIGGYGGVNKAQRSFDLNFGSSAANISASTNPVVHLKVDVNQVFTAPLIVNYANRFRVLSAGGNAKIIADNYSDMISFKSLDN